ncbi:EamA family transporter [Geminicoccaceae bacterium 1502E]|nr:EamA family transporter [Geminicoccaceae bacterium 1502E]
MRAEPDTATAGAVLPLYIYTCLAWSASWLGIRFQLGTVPPELSIAYRFLLAGLVLVLWCLWRRQKLRLPLREHGFVLLQGLFLFGGNYWLFYQAAFYVPTGLMAVVMGAIIAMNMAGARLFFGTALEPRALFGAAMGLAGIALVFLRDLLAFDLSSDGLKGLGLSLAATFCASLGNLVSVRNQRRGLPVVPVNALAMLQAGALTFVLAVTLGSPPVFDWRPGYVISLLYLAIFASAIAFGAYLTLLGRIGAARGAYVLVVTPVLAVLLSALFEDMALRPETAAGIALVLTGNVVILGGGAGRGGARR